MRTDASLALCIMCSKQRKEEEKTAWRRGMAAGVQRDSARRRTRGGGWQRGVWVLGMANGWPGDA